MTTIAGIRMNAADVSAVSSAASIDAQAEVLRLFGEHGTPLFRFCRSTLGNATDAEDVVQETFLKLLRHLQSGEDRSNLKSWLFTVAANGCRDRVRWRLRWLPWRAELDDRTVDPVEESPDVNRARTAFRALAPRDRLLLSLRAQGLSYREVAAAAGIQEQSVGRLLARALDRWKKATGRLESGSSEPAVFQAGQGSGGTMRCLTDVEVQTVVDDEATDASRAHAASCGNCRDRIDERRRHMAAVGHAHRHRPSVAHLEARLRHAMTSGRDVRGSTVLRPSAARPSWGRAGWISALATAAGVALIVFMLLPRLGAPTTLSANEILGRSLQTLTSGSGVELLEYEVTMDGMTAGPVVIRQLIDHSNPQRYKIESYAPDGEISTAISQDPQRQRRSQLIRVDGTNYIVRVGAIHNPVLSLPQMAQAHGRNQHRPHAGQVGSAADGARTDRTGGTTSSRYRR